MGVPAWVNAYIGLPFEERGRGPAYDCWGLVRHVLAGAFGIDVPSYAGGYETTRDHERLAGLIDAGKADDWTRIEPGAELPGDVLLLRMSGLPIHVGILVSPGWMLHTRAATGAVIERFEGLAWGRRVLGIYRHFEPALLSSRGRVAGGSPD
jgi:cell wall-associated NlpC family hydrolase